jgi:hypothetical protein
VEDETYQLKPMNCPFHVAVYKDGYYSYRDLPIRYAELGTVYRYERSGTMHGRAVQPPSVPLAFKDDQPPLAKPDRRIQFGRSSFAEHPHLIQETTVYDGHFGRNGGSSLADPVWRIHPLTELSILPL